MLGKKLDFGKTDNPIPATFRPRNCQLLSAGPTDSLNVSFAHWSLLRRHLFRDRKANRSFQWIRPIDV